MQATESSPLPTASALGAWLRLEQTDGVGLITAHALLARFQTPQAIFAASHAELLTVVTPARARALLAPPSAGLAAQVDAVQAWCAQPGNRLLTFDHGDYPPLLRQIAAAPLMLYVKGKPALLQRPAVAVVGSRNASVMGRQTAERMAHALAEAGVTIVSGLALGIDAAAHAGGLAGEGGTVAVIGTGADRIYPASNEALARRIAEHGCIVSEYALGTPPLRDNFPRRNRVISGLARAVLVVEAAARSGSLITARLAASQDRDVYAMPGSVHASLSKGCHRLIRDGAKLVETAADVLSELHIGIDTVATGSHFDDSFVDRVLLAMGDQPIRPETLAAHLQQPAAELQGQLLALELAGLLERLPGGWIQRLRR
ncbi:DNA processing protein DprA [Duganella sp. Leaf126]|uniref:DNA-processing protein DprA n=1 Tax=Duganella sp. Leaf126 TaxID=1736266 RepID=UPI0006FBBF3B|nr:DNA-processing protein DprA [Duganella sp. Leaf126]KQQ33783.1 DNA processing protein DprA [Duganella sp. Leaf126]